MSNKFNYSSIGKTVDGTTFCSGVETLAENIIEDSEEDATITFPSNTGWASLRSSAYKMTTENAEAHLPLPIYKIKKLLVKLPELRIIRALSPDYEISCDAKELKKGGDGVSFNNEVDTLNIIKYFLKKKKIAVPKINSDEMDFYYIESLKDLSQGSFNILEPTTNNKVTNFNNSICIVPGLCFDKENYRLGYAKGYYDKFLSNKNIYTIGLSYKETIIKKLPIDKYDIKLDKVIQ